MKLWQVLAGGAAAVTVLLWAGAASAAPIRIVAPPRPRRTSRDDGAVGDALRRLGNFIAAAKIDARTYRRDAGEGGLMTLGVRPGPRFTAPDAAALPRDVGGIDVEIDGWPR